MLTSFITAYPWDLLDEPDSTLDRLRAEMGLSGSAVWAAVPPVTQLRARPVEPRVFRTRGGLLFQPEPRHYEASRLKPTVSDWAKGRKVLPRIAQACADRQLDLRLIVSAAGTGRLAARHPEMACKNVWGDASQESVCLCNADVQAYLCGLVADVGAQMTAAGVVVTDFQIAWSEALHGDLQTAVPLDEAQRFLLTLCFCESCHQRADSAGIDTAMVRRVVQTILSKAGDVRKAEPIRLDSLLADQPLIAKYHRMHVTELSSLLRRLTAAGSTELLVVHDLGEPLARQHAGLEWELAAGALVRLEREEQLTEALDIGARRRELSIPAHWTVGPGAPDLVRALSQAAEARCAGFQFEDLGLLPESGLTAIRQALRLARRQEGGH